MRAAFSPRGPSARPVLAAIAALVVVGVVVACGTGGYVKGGDPVRGKQLFVSKCGSCHTLAAAGTTQTIGPNLDHAFGADRQQGFPDSSIQQIVADQIRDPLQPITCPGPETQFSNESTKCAPGSPVTPTGSTVMPAKLVDGQDLVDVSWFVAKCAGNDQDASCKSTGGGVTAKDGKTIFQQAGCTGCHTLKDAGSTGTVGPNLDQATPPKSLVIQRVTNGKGAMPSFKGKLTPQQIQAVADYVSSVAGK